MSALRAVRLARTCVIVALLLVVNDHDTIFNSLDMLTVLFTIAAVTLLSYSKGRD